MAVYKDKKRGTWYTSFPYVDWTGKRCRKLKRGFLTKKEAQNWENHFKLQKANSLDMTFEDFYGIYEADVKPKIRYNTWCTKEHIIKTKILPYFKDLSMRDITPRDDISRSLLTYIKTFFGFCISGALMVVAVKGGIALCTNLVSFDLSSASEIQKCILMTVQMSVTPIVISGLVKGSDAVTSRMF